MKKNLTLFILFLLLASCSPVVLESETENPVGIGLLGVDFSNPVYLYSEDGDKKAATITADKILFGKESGKIKFTFSGAYDSIKPYRLTTGSSDIESKQLINSGLGPEPSQLIFSVIERKKDGFVVLINEDTKKKAFLKSGDASLNYESWETYLKRIAAVSPIDENIYDSPNGKLLYKDSAHRYLKVIEIKNDWISVSTKLWEAPEKNTPETWIQWKKNNQLNIKIVEMFLE